MLFVATEAGQDQADSPPPVKSPDGKLVSARSGGAAPTSSDPPTSSAAHGDQSSSPQQPDSTVQSNLSPVLRSTRRPALLKVGPEVGSESGADGIAKEGTELHAGGAAAATTQVGSPRGPAPPKVRSPSSPRSPRQPASPTDRKTRAGESPAVFKCWKLDLVPSRTSRQSHPLTQALQGLRALSAFQHFKVAS